MSRIGEEMSFIIDDMQGSPEVSHLYRRAHPFVPSFYEQGRYLENFPVLYQVRSRINAVFSRVAEARETIEKEMRR